MTVYVLSQYRIESLENSSPGEMVLDDLIQIIELQTTRIIDDEHEAIDLFRKEKKLKYFYPITFSQRHI